MFGPTLKKKKRLKGSDCRVLCKRRLSVKMTSEGNRPPFQHTVTLTHPVVAFFMFFLDKAENNGMLNLFRSWSSMSSFVRVCRSLWEPLWLGEPSQCIWPELHSPQEGQDVPAAGVGSSAGRHPHHPGNRCHHLTGPVFLPSTRGRQWRWVH